MTEKQERAIKQMNRALKALNDADIKICGMDCDLLYATGDVLKDFSSEHREGGTYCAVAQANVANRKGTGIFKADCYQDSGAW